MTTRKELDTFYAITDKLTEGDKRSFARVLVAILKPEGEETDKGNLSTNTVLVDMLFQALGITTSDKLSKSGLTFWVSPLALSALKVLAK